MCKCSRGWVLAQEDVLELDLSSYAYAIDISLDIGRTVAFCQDRVSSLIERVGQMKLWLELL